MELCKGRMSVNQFPKPEESSLLTKISFFYIRHGITYPLCIRSSIKEAFVKENINIIPNATLNIEFCVF